MKKALGFLALLLSLPARAGGPTRAERAEQVQSPPSAAPGLVDRIEQLELSVRRYAPVMSNPQLERALRAVGTLVRKHTRETVPAVGTFRLEGFAESQPTAKPDSPKV